MPQAMMWVFAVLIVLAMGGIALLAAGRGEPMQPAFDDRPDARVPLDRSITPEDLRRVRFSLALRGYRMSEVDALLARLAHEQEMRAAPPSVGQGPQPGAGPGAEPGAQPTAQPGVQPGARQGVEPGGHSAPAAAGDPVAGSSRSVPPPPPPPP